SEAEGVARHFACPLILGFATHPPFFVHFDTGRFRGRIVSFPHFADLVDCGAGHLLTRLGDAASGSISSGISGSDGPNSVDHPESDYVPPADSGVQVVRLDSSAVWG